MPVTACFSYLDDLTVAVPMDAARAPSENAVERLGQIGLPQEAETHGVHVLQEKQQRDCKIGGRPYSAERDEMDCESGGVEQVSLA